MRRERAIEGAELPQVALDQREVHRLLGGDLQEIGHEGGALRRAEAASHIEREVDGDELDMRQRVPQGDPPAFRSAAPPLGHTAGREQLEPRGQRGAGGHGVGEIPCERALAPLSRQRPRGHHLGARLAGQQRGADSLREAVASRSLGNARHALR